tara:strand:- start:181 stop:516 length:336 start_codon:yes stop_codon:yes gene_type:complete
MFCNKFFCTCTSCNYDDKEYGECTDCRKFVCEDHNCAKKYCVKCYASRIQKYSDYDLCDCSIVCEICYNFDGYCEWSHITEEGRCVCKSLPMKISTKDVKKILDFFVKKKE